MAHPAGPSLTRSVASAICDAGAALGHTVELVDLVADEFDPVFGPADHAAFTAAGPTPLDVRQEQQRIDRADHLILVHPVYWWSMPAVLKGWIDRVFVSAWAFEENADGGIVKKLGRLNVHLIALAGADASAYAKHEYRQAMRAQIDHGIFDFCGAPVITSELIDGKRKILPRYHRALPALSAATSRDKQWQPRCLRTQKRTSRRSPPLLETAHLYISRR